jgi:transcriptional regulator with XRE-family HTH domain
LISAAHTKRKLANRLRELRREKKWSQERLAEAADMHRTYLAGIERALRNPSLENLVKLANALDLSMADLFCGGDTGGKTPREPRSMRNKDHKEK